MLNPRFGLDTIAPTFVSYAHEGDLEAIVTYVLKTHIFDSVSLAPRLGDYLVLDLWNAVIRLWKKKQSILLYGY